VRHRQFPIRHTQVCGMVGDLGLFQQPIEGCDRLFVLPTIELSAPQTEQDLPFIVAILVEIAPIQTLDQLSGCDYGLVKTEQIQELFTTGEGGIIMLGTKIGKPRPLHERCRGTIKRMGIDDTTAIDQADPLLPQLLVTLIAMLVAGINTNHQ